MAIINGKAYDHSSHLILIAGVPRTLIKELSYSQARDGETMIHGTSRVPKARTFGKILPGDVSLQLYQGDWEDLRVLLGPGYMQRTFPIVITRQTDIQGVPGIVHTDILKDCQIKNVEHSTSEGGEAQITTVTLSCMLVLEDGVPPTLDIPTI